MADKRKSVAVSTEDLNSYGTWVVTDGIDFSDFLNNPVMLYNHKRNLYGEAMHLPPGKWENLRMEGDKLLADPVFDEQDPFAVQLKNKFEQGILNAASIGIHILEWSDEPALIKEGQRMMTITKCRLYEISVVDVPSNRNAVVLYDANDAGQLVELSLSDNGDVINPNQTAVLPKIKKTSNMTFSPELIKSLGLPDGATEQQVATAITLQAAELRSKDARLLELEAERKKEKAQQLIDAAIGDGKLVAGERDGMIALAEGDYDTVKKLLDGKQGYKSVTPQLQGGGNGGAGTLSLVSQYEDLDKKGELATLKAQDPTRFAELENAYIEHIRSSGLYKS